MRGFISIKRGPKFKGKLKNNTGEYVLYVFVSTRICYSFHQFSLNNGVDTED